MTPPAEDANAFGDPLEGVDDPCVVDIVIVNWNTGKYLHESIESIRLGMDEGWRLGHLIVVDNASTDDSLERAGSVLDFSDTVVIRNADNRGFGAACNQGAAAGEGDLILFLNPDARLLPTTLSQVCEFMRSPAGRVTGICGVSLFDESGQPAMVGGPFPTLGGVIGQVTGLSSSFPRLLPRRRVLAGEHSGRIDHVIGAFLLIRRHLFEEVRGFDERYFMYYEEVDLCLRCRDRGWATHLLSDVHAFHRGNVSSEQIKSRRLFYSMRSRRQFASRHWSRGGARALSAVTYGIELPTRAAKELLDERKFWPTETLHGFSQYARYWHINRKRDDE